MISGMQSCIEVSSLAYAHGTRTTLAGVDLMVAPGQVHGVLGPRWAGKTTLLRILAGELAPSSGQSRYPGRPCSSATTAARRSRSAWTRRRAGGYRSRGRSRAGRTSCWSTSPPRGSTTTRPRPRRTLVRRFIAQGGAAVWATRQLDALTGVATDVTLLADGRVRYSGTAEALSERALPGLVAGLRALRDP